MRVGVVPGGRQEPGGHVHLGPRPLAPVEARVGPFGDHRAAEQAHAGQVPGAFSQAETTHVSGRQQRAKGVLVSLVKTRVVLSVDVVEMIGEFECGMVWKRGNITKK